jgi:hypothetical protein
MVIVTVTYAVKPFADDDGRVSAMCHYRQQMMEPLWSPVVATARNWSQIQRRRKPQK